MKLGYELIFAVLFFCCSSANAQYYYSPDNSSSLLLITKKSDLKFSSTIPINAPINFQLAYSPFNKLSLTLSYFRHETAVENVALSTNGKVLSASIGTYAFFKRSNNKLEGSHIPGGFLIDFNAGYSKANIKNNYVSITSASLNYDKFYGQIGLHFISRWISVSYATKFSTLDYKTGEINGTPAASEIKPITEQILVNEPFMLLETDLRVHIGNKKLRGFAGISMIHPNILHKSILADRHMIFSAGLIIGVNDFLADQKRKAI